MREWLISIHAPVKGATLCFPATHSFLPISIHAPVKGATHAYTTRRGRGGISIHAPAKGATVLPPLHQPPPAYFNPRSREGSDFQWLYMLFVHSISIHAPAKGATIAYRYTAAHRNFNPRSREGSDSATRFHASSHSHFNPRSREGSDGKARRFVFSGSIISIHAPAKGATISRAGTSYH